MKRSVYAIGILSFAHCNSNDIFTSTSKSIVPIGADTNQGCIHDRYHAHSFVNIRGGAATRSSTQLAATYASLLAGSIGGAIGVGVSYPFDTLSTKAQVSTGVDDINVPPSLSKSIVRIFKDEGIAGFFEGVLITMIGQAIIKAIQFAANELTLSWLAKHSTIKSTIVKMTLSGILSGLVSSFIVSPIEMVKIRMQAQNKHATKNNGDENHSPLIYNNEIDCARWIINNEGLVPLFTHGLWITIIREIPSFAIYFAVYGWLARSSLALHLGGHAAPLLFGAIAGWAMWIPTYPIDIVKTIEQVQTLEKGKEMLTWRQITAKLYRSGGVKAFFEGLEPKLARAAIKHAVTFWCYEVMMKILRPTPSLQ